LRLRGANVNVKANNGATPLIAATDWSRTDNMQLLLDHGADIGAKDHDGNAPPLLAAAGGTLDLAPAAKLVVAHHANVEARNKRGDAPLLLAASGGNTELVELHTRAKDVRRDTALLLGIKNSRADIVRLLQ
jgi:ankyrin repeat protein